MLAKNFPLLILCCSYGSATSARPDDQKMVIARQRGTVDLVVAPRCLGARLGVAHRKFRIGPVEGAGYASAF